MREAARPGVHVEFEELFDRAFPPPQQKLPLVIEVDSEDGRGPSRSRVAAESCPGEGLNTMVEACLSGARLNLTADRN